LAHMRGNWYIWSIFYSFYRVLERCVYL